MKRKSVSFSVDKVVLLFYKDYEQDSFVRYDRYLKRVLRPIYHRFTNAQKVSGFYVWCQLLIKSLENQGYEVHLNNYSLTSKHPKYPVGLVGYPHLLNSWTLPNPALLGPALFDHPRVEPRLMEDPRFKLYLVTCQWMQDMFASVYGDSCVLWYAGMDLEQWPDTKSHPKKKGVLIYDKIRWNRDRMVPELLESIINYLERQGINYSIIRYRYHDQAKYQESLSESRMMIFLCEHETQGLAYQEALASNVPVLAWDNGFWLDPNRPKYESDPVAATSVPYFSPECGERFRDASSFENSFDQMWSRLDTYKPRQFVEQELSLKGSAELYLNYYEQIASMEF